MAVYGTKWKDIKQPQVHTQSIAQSYTTMSYNDNTVLDCIQHPEEDLQPILREDVDIAEAALKKKST